VKDPYSPERRTVPIRVSPEPAFSKGSRRPRGLAAAPLRPPRVFLALIWMLSGPVFPAGAQQAPLAITHVPLTQFPQGATIDVRAEVSGDPDGVSLFFRVPGVEGFQVRPLEKAGRNAFVLAFDTSTLPAASFDYYLEAWKGEVRVQSPAGAPEELYSASGLGEAPPAIPQDIPTPQAEEARFKLPVNVTGNGVGLIHHKITREGAAGSQGNGNLRVALQARPSSLWGLNLDSNFALTTIPQPGYKDFNLSNMMLTISRGFHTLRAGDLNLNESEFTLYGLGRRGFDYTYDNQKLYVRGFTASTQQVVGFAGFGFPGPETRVYGGAAGYKVLGDALGLKLVFVGGKDNPHQAANAGAPQSTTAREGTVVAVSEETHLFQQALNLRAEFATSHYDPNLNDESLKFEDIAYQFGGDARWRAFTFGARYRYIGRDFNSIGLAYIANDRKGLEAVLGFMKGIVNIQGTYTREQDNVKDDAARPTTKNGNAQVMLNLNLSTKLVFTGGYRRSDQATVQTGPVTFNQDGLTNEYTGGLSWMPSPSLALNCTIIDSRITSQANPGMDTRALTVNAGGSLQAGQRLMFCPAVSWSRSTLSAASVTTRSENATLTAEYFFIRQILSIAFYGTGSRMELPGAGPMDLLDLTGALNVQAGTLFKIGTLTLSLRGNYNRQKSDNLDLTDVRVFVQGDLAF
jgi:hypothetical protein